VHMEREQLRKLLKNDPFQPFRVYVKDGRIYEVRHPRMNQLADTFINIGIPSPEYAPPICDHTEHVRLSEIERLEVLPIPSPPATW